MHDPNDRSTRHEAVERRKRMVRRRTARTMRKAIIASAGAFVVVLAMRPTPKTSAALRAAGTTASLAAAPGTIATDLSTATTSVAATAPGTQPAEAPKGLWRRPGDLLKRERVADAPAFAIATDLRLRERHESLNRWHRIYSYSAKYRIKPDLSRRIYDAAITAGLEPELGFRLVRVESVFDPKAVSSAGALGLTQLMPSTARLFEPGVTREQLLTPEVNLRIGFRYLRGLIREYDGNLKLALLVYNRGPAAAGRAMAMGNRPANGYESLVMKGYRGRGTLD